MKTACNERFFCFYDEGVTPNFPVNKSVLANESFSVNWRSGFSLQFILPTPFLLGFKSSFTRSLF